MREQVQKLNQKIDFQAKVISKLQSDLAALQAENKIFRAGKVPRALCPDCRDQCLERATKQFCIDLATLKEQYRWRLVRDELPKETEEDLRPDFLISNAEGAAVQKWRHYDFGWSFDGYTGPPIHWMPIPQLPSEEDNGKD